jgi:hypothetical protein
MKRALFCAAIIAVILSSCGGGAGSKYQTMDTVTPADKPTQTTDAKSTSTADTVAASSHIVPQSGAPNIVDWDRKIIKNAHVTLELKDYNTFNNSLHFKLKSFGAYIAQELQSETNTGITNDISIKVPVDKFEDLMNSLGGDSIKMIEKNIATEDVTGEVVDTKARIEAKKQVRERYMELLKQAKTMKDVLDVQQEINGIQEDIESASGKVGYMVHSAAYSTINLKYYQYLNLPTPIAVLPEPTFLTSMADAFKTGGGVVVNILVFFISIWPLVLAAVLLIFYLRKRSASGNKQKAAIE